MRTWGFRAAAVLCAGALAGALSGCAVLLERTYATSAPHSRRYWESESTDTLRAENYQDIVNDLLILIGQHSEEATLRLYDFPDEQTALENLEAAALEVQQETALGAYAAAYITTNGQSQRGFYEARVQIAYRREAKQIQAMVNITAFSALPDLLEAALREEKTELVVRPGYWPADGRERVRQAVEQVRAENAVPESEPWLVYAYPGWESVGIVEIRLAPTAGELEAYPPEDVRQEDTPPGADEPSGADEPPETAEASGAQEAAPET